LVDSRDAEVVHAYEEQVEEGEKELVVETTW
jgi:hypothetical protein